MSKFKVVASGEIVDAERLTEGQEVLTLMGLIDAKKGSWIVRNTEGTKSVVEDKDFGKLYKGIELEDVYPTEPVIPAVPEPVVPEEHDVPVITSYSAEPKAEVKPKAKK